MLSVIDAEGLNPTSLQQFAAHQTLKITMPESQHMRKITDVDKALWIKQ
jgi:hypothetical protein